MHKERHNVGVYVSGVFVALVADKVHWQAVQSDIGADNSNSVSWWNVNPQYYNHCGNDELCCTVLEDPLPLRICYERCVFYPDEDFIFGLHVATYFIEPDPLSPTREASHNVHSPSMCSLPNNSKHTTRHGHWE